MFYHYSNDSGSGLFIEFKNIFYLRGIVSASLADRMKTCDVSNFVLFTDVSKFTDWIENPNTITCGVMRTTTSLLQGGSVANLELFPWTVAIYNSNKPAHEYTHLSTGTLVTKRHVVVAAFNVVFAGYDKATADTLKMYFGLFDLDYRMVQGLKIVSSGVSKIIVHENYKNENIPHKASIAVLVADRSVEFSNKIQPICMPDYSTNYDDIVGNAGYAVSWGFDESKNHSRKKKYLRMKIDDKDECDSNYGQFDYSRYFCTSSNSTGAACWADDPFYVKDGNKWYLRGLLASFYYLPGGSGLCNPSLPTLYEDVAFYAQWVESVTLQN